MKDKTLRDGGERQSSEANISAARRDDPPSQNHEKIARGAREKLIRSIANVNEKGRCYSYHLPLDEDLDRIILSAITKATEAQNYRTIARLEKELAAERQRRARLQQQLESDMGYEHQQLLSALAAIEKKNAVLLACAESDQILSGFPKTHAQWSAAEKVCREVAIIEADLSLLHQHDAELKKQWESELFTLNEYAAEVRKPLVEALRLARETIVALNSHAIYSDEVERIDAALVQCKE